MSVEPSTLERSALERKDREELTTIAQALGVKPPSRARKAQIVQLILEITGVEPAPAADAASPGDGGDPPAARAQGRSTDGRQKEADVDDATETGTDTGDDAGAPAAGSEPPSEWELEFGGTTDVVEAPGRADTPAPGGNGAPVARTADARPVSSRSAGGSRPAGGQTNGRERGGDGRAQSPGNDRPAAGGNGGSSAISGGPDTGPDTGQGNGGTSDQGQGGSGQAVQTADSQPGRGQQAQGQGGQGQGRADGGDGSEPGNRRRRRRGRRGKDDQAPTEEFSGEPVEVEGMLDLRDEGYGFLRVRGYLPSKDDIYVSVRQVRQFGLRKGDRITGASRPAMRNEKNPALLRIDEVNGVDPEQARKRRRFEDLTPLFPDEKLTLETAKDPTNMTARIVDLISPVGKGQRGLIVSPPKAGKTAIVKQIPRPVETNNPEVKLMVLLVDERPEEVTDMRRWLRNESSEVVASTFDRPSEEHTQVAELTIERAKRLVEDGHDVCIILDGITRLARAYNLAAPATGRIMSGGVDSGALYPPKRFFGAARNIEEGGNAAALELLIDRMKTFRTNQEFLAEVAKNRLAAG